MSGAERGAMVELVGVGKTYRQGKVDIAAVRELTLAVKAGEFTALVGPSGSGKTTTLNLIGALDVPDAGQVRIGGRDLSRLSRRELALVRRDQIGFVFQSHNLVPVLTAYENTELVLDLQGVPRAERDRRVNEVLRAVGLAELAGRRPDELSGGQQQRVAIARAIAPKPKVVLADEPTASLDSQSAESLLDLMETLNQEHGVTFLFSTHDERVMRRARRIVKLRDGRLLEDEVRA